MQFNSEKCCPPVAFPPKRTVGTPPDPCAGFSYSPELALWNVGADTAFSPLTLNFGDDLVIQLRNLAPLPNDPTCCPAPPTIFWGIEPGSLTMDNNTVPATYLGVTFESNDPDTLRVINFGTNSIVFFITANYQICGQNFSTGTNFDVLTI